MSIGGTPIPKREIIAQLIQIIPVNQIRDLLKIQPTTDLSRRLSDFTKIQLIEVLQSSEEGKTKIEEIKANYPLTSNPTLYLVSVSFWPDRQALFEKIESLAKQLRNAAVQFGSDRSVQSIYMITGAREYQAQIPFIEISLVYEKKIEYVASDPAVEDYGEVCVIYSLEKALIWYSEQFNHALLLCGDFPAVKPILYYGSTKLGIRWQLPYLSEEMLKRIAEDATPRTASLSRLRDDPGDELDVQTMTISDQGLGESRSYRRLTQDNSRHQTSGFYSSHPDLVFGGLGIARQYGRIWTPARLRKDTLLALSINLIQKTEQELAREVDMNLNGFIDYYRNSPITFSGKKVNASQRFIVEELTKAIIIARRSPNNETTLDLAFIWDLVIQFETIDLFPALEVHCENCGYSLLRCPRCQSPYEPKEENQQIVFMCPDHSQELISNNQNVVCECGAELEITYSTDIRIFPGAELLKTLHEFLIILENQRYDGSFVIIGNVLRLIPKEQEELNRYSLNSLRFWRVRAHIHQRTIIESRTSSYTRILFRIKEKCSRNGRHPTKEMCDACMNEVITKSRIQSGNDICLPRLFGYAIDMDFDGIHHGHEIADIRYSDVLDETGEQLNLGIHLKSRENPRVRGLGRSVRCVKGLYTQYCYSAYLSAIKGEEINVIGISVPNILNDQVIENFEYLSAQLGFPLIILSEDEWVKILDAAIEKSEVGN